MASLGKKANDAVFKCYNTNDSSDEEMSDDGECSGENEEDPQFMEFLKDQNSDDQTEAAVLRLVSRISVWHRAEPPQQ